MIPLGQKMMIPLGQKRWKKDIRRRIPYGDKYFSNMTYTESRADDEDCCI